MQVPAAPAQPMPAATSAPPEIPIAVSAKPAVAGPAPSSSLADLLDEAQSAPRPAPATTTRLCPGCGMRIDTGAVLCVHCGYDTRTGMKHQTLSAPAEGPAESKQRKKKRSRGELPQGLAFLRGCAVSAGFTLMGVIVWWAVAYYLDIQLGLIAWAVGGLAGAGMMLGYGHEDALPGIAAAVIAFLGIIVAKVLIFASLFLPLFTDPDRFAEEMADEAAVEEEFDMADELAANEEEMAAEEAPGEAAVNEAALDDEAAEEVNPAVAEEAPADEELDEEEAVDEGVPVAAMGVAFLIFFGLTMFGFVDIIFVLLACATAYKMGSGMGGDD